jgi:Leucine-rich repeat (LRR) protein
MAHGVDKANRRIDDALAAGDTSLDLSGLQLTEIPLRVADLAGLTKLDLENNYLRELPGWLAAMPREWFVTLGPYLQHLIRILKHAAPLAAPVLGIAVDVLNQQVKADCDLMKELVLQ